jgi:hypothetical protein
MMLLPSLEICVVEKELGQSAYALPQFACFWWIRSGKVKNSRTGLVQVHRRMLPHNLSFSIEHPHANR